MHIYNWYHSNITGIHYVHEYVTVHYRAIPLLSAFPYSFPFAPIRLPLLTWNPLAVIGSRPPRSQVARKLIFPFPSPYPYTPHSKIPAPRGLSGPNIHSLGRHRDLAHKIQHNIASSLHLTPMPISIYIHVLHLFCAAICAKTHTKRQQYSIDQTRQDSSYW
jgi:hypothetical protein